MVFVRCVCLALLIIEAAHAFQHHQRSFVQKSTWEPSLVRGVTQQQWKPKVRSTPFNPLSLNLAESPSNNESEKKLPFIFDPNTKGGAVFLSLVLFIVPIIVYNILVSMGYDEIQTGQTIGIGFTVFATLAWVSTYLFRVVTKDMTYAKQLKDYENAVIAKRLEELDEDELQALVEEVEKEEF